VIHAGFVGESTEEATTRLYHDEELNCYSDIPNGDILASERIEADKPSSSMTLTRVWVNPDAKITYGRSDMSQFGAMLSGPLTAQLGGAGAAYQLRTQLCTLFVACRHTFQYNCFTQFYQGCGGGGSGHIFCGGGGSAVDACPSGWGCGIDWQQQTPVIQQTVGCGTIAQGFAAQPQMQAMGGQVGGFAQANRATPFPGTFYIQCQPQSFQFACQHRHTIFDPSCFIIACHTRNPIQCTIICTIGSPGCPIPTPHYGGYDPGPLAGGGGFAGGGFGG
jgi:hypothetical protein